MTATEPAATSRKTLPLRAALLAVLLCAAAWFVDRLNRGQSPPPPPQAALVHSELFFPARIFKDDQAELRCRNSGEAEIKVELHGYAHAGGKLEPRAVEKHSLAAGGSFQEPLIAAVSSASAAAAIRLWKISAQSRPGALYCSAKYIRAGQSPEEASALPGLKALASGFTLTGAKIGAAKLLIYEVGDLLTAEEKAPPHAAGAAKYKTPISCYQFGFRRRTRQHSFVPPLVGRTMRRSGRISQEMAAEPGLFGFFSRAERPESRFAGFLVFVDPSGRPGLAPLDREVHQSRPVPAQGALKVVNPAGSPAAFTVEILGGDGRVLHSRREVLGTGVTAEIDLSPYDRPDAPTPAARIRLESDRSGGLIGYHNLRGRKTALVEDSSRPKTE